MVQIWLFCYLLVDGQGNFGFVDGDFFVVMCYIEVRFCKLLEEMFEDFDKEIVDFQLNFDDLLQELQVFFIKILNFFVNGVVGIVVGMVINMVLYNLIEVVDVCIVYVDNKEMELEDFFQYVKVFDFFMGGIIYGYEGVCEVLFIGCGCVVICVKVEIEELGGCEVIIVFEIFYQINKLELIKKIVDFVNDKKIEGILDICDELD